MHTGFLKRRLLLGLVSIASLAGVFALQLAQTATADAEGLSPDATVGFCGNVLLGPQGGGGAQTWCQVGMVGTYQAYAWGEHSVCVGIPPLEENYRCSSGTNGVYSGELPASYEYGYPTIHNNVNINNHASGIYLTR